MSAVRISRKSAALLTLCCTALFLCFTTSVVEAYSNVPILRFFAKEDGSGDKQTSRQICTEGGGFLVAESNSAKHAAVIEQAEGLVGSAGTPWFAYLGSDTTQTKTLTFCPDNAPSKWCYWRWNQGRWLDYEDDQSLANQIPNVGVTHATGNFCNSSDSDKEIVSTPHADFPSWFTPFDSTPANARPNALFGRHLLAMGTGAGSSKWSDNLNTGGYSYQGWTYAPTATGVKFDTAAAAATASSFIAICEVQAPSRRFYERENTSSGLQANWWGIFMAILFVVCLVSFIIIWACQEREDMDEPPEDAPEWAKSQTSGTQQTKQFVSQRSFRQHDLDDEASRKSTSYEDDTGARNPLTRGVGSSDTSDTGYGEGYSNGMDEGGMEMQSGTYQDQQMMMNGGMQQQQQQW